MSASRRAGRIAGWIVGAAVLASLVLARWAESFPPLASPLRLHVTFPAGVAGTGEPLLVTGYRENADFLVVRYVDADTAVLVYDVWGMGGPTSRPFALRPGVRRTLEIEMPTLAHVATFRSHEKRPLRLVLDGEELAREDVYFHRRAPSWLHVGLNPVGGTVAKPEFRGTLARADDGRVLRGDAKAIFTKRERVAWFFGHEPWRLVVIGLASVGAGAAAAFVVRKKAEWLARIAPGVFAGHARAPHGALAATTLACALAFTALITQGTFDLIHAEDYGHFFDHQAASLLRGRLDVPPAAIGGEAFVVDGKTYGYFGLTPSLLRLPFVAAGVAFGELSRAFMLGYFIACLGAAYALLVHATRVLAGPAAWPSRAAVVLLVASAGLGSTLLFLGARAYIYHEAILCGAALALWSGWCALRHLAAPGGRAWLPALACAVLALHARPPAGLFALGVLGVVGVWLGGRSLRAGDSRGAGNRLRAGSYTKPLMIVVGVLVGLGTFSAVSYWKFRTLDGSPFRYSVQYTEARRAAFENRNFHLANLPRNVATYVWEPNLHFERGFPWLHFGRRLPTPWPSAKIDLAEPTLGFLYAMPALFGLAFIGGAWAWLRAPALRPALATLGLGVLPMALALCAAIVTSHRYTGDFCAFLIAAAACGLAALDADPARRRGRWLTAVVALAAVSIAVNAALALHFQRALVWGVPEPARADYQRLRARVDNFFGVGPR